MRYIYVKMRQHKIVYLQIEKVKINIQMKAHTNLKKKMCFFFSFNISLPFLCRNISRCRSNTLRLILRKFFRLLSNKINVALNPNDKITIKPTFKSWTVPPFSPCSNRRDIFVNETVDRISFQYPSRSLFYAKQWLLRFFLFLIVIPRSEWFLLVFLFFFFRSSVNISFYGFFQEYSLSHSHTRRALSATKFR